MNSGPLSERMKAGGSAQDQQIRQHVDDVDRVQLPLYPNHQTLPRVLVDHVQHPEGMAVMGALIDEERGIGPVQLAWDGSFEGVPLLPGTYVWVLQCDVCT